MGNTRLFMIHETRTPEEKKIWWAKQMKGYIDRIEILANAGAEERVIRAMRNEYRGGNCVKCNKPYKKIVFDNGFGAGTYYMPTCGCYLTCTMCGNILVAEELSGQLHLNDGFCNNCDWPLTPNAKEIFKKSFDEKTWAFLRTLKYKRKKQVLEPEQGGEV